MNLIIAEKPSLARSIAEGLGCKIKKEGYITNTSGDIAITWQFGHLFELYDVNDYEFGVTSKDKMNWKSIPLPYIPTNFKFKIKSQKGIKPQYNVIKSLVKKADVVINAGDPDREGQILVDITLKEIGYDITKAKRLWLPEITNEEIKKAYKNLLNNKDCMNIHNEGIARMYTDWLFGINATVYATNNTNKFMRIGRVLVPIVKFIYDRDMEIENFVSKPYYQNENDNTLKLVCNEKFEDKTKCQNQRDLLNNIGIAKIVNSENKNITKQPPKLFSLSKLQSAITKKLGIAPKQSLKVIQELYETGYITYPRTSSEYLGENEKDKVKEIIKALNDSRLEFKDKKSLFDSSKVESHSAITPTAKIPKDLDKTEQSIYNIVKNRFCANFTKEDTIVQNTKLDVMVGDYSFKVSGEVVLQKGFMEFESVGVQTELPNLKVGDTFNVEFKTIDKKTTPPPHITYDMLINFLNNPFKSSDTTDLTDEEYKNIIKGIVIGTEATRTGIIENAISNGYIKETKNKNSIVYNITDMGKYLVYVLDTLKLNMYKEKSIEVSKQLNNIYENNLTINNLIENIRKEIEFMKVELETEQLEKPKTEKEVFLKESPYGEIYKKATKAGHVYTNDKKGADKFEIWENTSIFRNKVKLKEKEVKGLILGEPVKFKLISSKNQTEYTANIICKGLDEKGYLALEVVSFD